MKVQELYNKIQDLSEQLSAKKIDQYGSLFELGMKILMQYKVEGGEQKEAYDALLSLYTEYAKNEEDETQMDYVADILDYVCGWESRESYKLWDKYLFNTDVSC